MPSVLEVTDLRTQFTLRTGNVVAVDGVSLSVDEGESLGIVGESGCGKTTLGLSIMRLLPGNGRIASGRIQLGGRDLATLDEREMRAVRGNEVALIPQNPMTSLNPTKTIGWQIVEAVRLHRDVSTRQARQRALDVLTLVEMPRPAERVDQYPHELSGGLRQRVMIAMALACEPKLLIADEPTTALDVTIQAQILDLIDGLRERLRMAVILITHDMGVIAGRTDNVAVMYAGKVVERTKTETLFTRMRHPYSDALLASVPKIGPNQSDRLVSIPGLPPDLSMVHTNCRFNPRCTYATDRCRDEEPPLTPVTGDDASRQLRHMSSLVFTQSMSSTARWPTRRRARRRRRRPARRGARRAPRDARYRAPREGVPGDEGRRVPPSGGDGQSRLRRLVQHPHRRGVRPRG